LGSGPHPAPPAAERARRAPRPRVLGLCLLRRERVPPGRAGLPAGAVLGADDVGRAPPDDAPPHGRVKHETAPVPGRVLLVGTYVTHAHNHSVGEDLGTRLRAAGWQVTMTSHATGRLARLADMLATTWRTRDRYDVAQVDVYRGLAFGWAEAVCARLRRLDKPYVLTLHGGNLPMFAERWPGRVRRLLGSAEAVTTPSRYLLEAMAPYQEGMRLVPNPVDLASYPFRL